MSTASQNGEYFERLGVQLDVYTRAVVLKLGVREVLGGGTQTKC